MSRFAPFAVALCGVFALGALGAFAWAVRETFRRGRPLCSWLDRRFWGLAAVPLLMASGLALVNAALLDGASADLQRWSSLLLTLGTAFGTAAAVLFGTVLVFEDGVRTGSGRLVVDWRDVSDYVDRKDGRYAFFSYPHGHDRRRTNLRVPRGQRSRFDAVVSACVDARLDYGLPRSLPRRTTPF